MKKLLVATQYFYPENFRINDMCQEWVKRGYDVTVLTGCPNYPLGDIYDGYKREYKEEEWNGVHIVRLPVFPRGHSKFTLARFCFSYVREGKKWIDKKTKENNGKFPFDIFFTYEVSPMTQALLGAYASKKYNVKSILYVQDLWPENVIEVMGIKNPLIIKPIEKMVEKIYRDTNYILATSNSFVEEIRKRIKDVSTWNKVSFWPQYAEDFYVPMGKHVENGEESKQYKNALKKYPELDNDKFKICFTGNIGKAQGLEILVRVAKLLKLEYNNKVIDKQIQFVIVGDGKNRDDLINEINNIQVEEMFTFLGKKESIEIPTILGLCDCAFVSFKDCELFAKTIPAKLQSYMACGMPILASTRGETNKIIKEAHCGISALTYSDKDVYNSICSFIMLDKNQLAMYSNNARQYYTNNFAKCVLMKEIEDLLNSI